MFLKQFEAKRKRMQPFAKGCMRFLLCHYKDKSTFLLSNFLDFLIFIPSATAKAAIAMIR